MFYIYHQVVAQETISILELGTSEHNEQCLPFIDDTEAMAVDKSNRPCSLVFMLDLFWMMSIIFLSIADFSICLLF